MGARTAARRLGRKRLRIGAAAIAAALLLFGVARAEVVTGGHVRVSFHGQISPRALPRAESAPVSLHLEGTVRPVGKKPPPVLRRVTVAINRHARLSLQGMPVCPWRQLRSRTTQQALAVCRDALVGSGHFSAHVDIPDQSPFPAHGRLLAFNTILHGHHALAAHVFGRKPLPTVQVVPISFQRRSQGAFGLTLAARMPEVGDEWGYVSGFDLTVHRRFFYKGRWRSFLSASCAAPKGFHGALFKAARATYYLSGGKTLTRVLSGSCRVKSPAGG